MLLRVTVGALGWLALGLAPAAAATAPPEKPAVQFQVVRKAYVQKPVPGETVDPDKPKTVTTDAVILENEYIQATVLPHMEARLVRVVFKKTGRDLFWVNDVVEPWSMGGTFFPFPLRESGGARDPAACWRVVRAADGSVTVAVDRRFASAGGASFSALRMAVHVTLRPGSAALEYVARLDNPLPLRQGFRLWNMAQFPRQSGAAVLFPVGSVTDAAVQKSMLWPVWEEIDHSRLGSWQASVFAIDPQGDWAGVYYAQADANHLVLKPRYTAPGARLHVLPPKASLKDEPTRADQTIEIWNGSNPAPAHPGHYLQAFGTYILPMRLAMVSGIGPIAWANDRVAVAYERTGGGATVRVVSFEPQPRCHVMVRTSQETAQATGTLRPDQPIVVKLEHRAEPALVTVVSGEDSELAEVSLPRRPKPTPPETLKTLRGAMDPWNWVAMELWDWAAGAPNLADAAKTLTGSATTHDVQAALAAARVLMRAERPGSARWQSVRNRLDFIAGADPKHRYVEAYLGMMLALEAKGRPTPVASRHFAAADRLPAGHYLMALEALAAGKTLKAVSHLQRCASEAPPVAIGLGANAITGNERLHPAALPGGQWPTMLLAATYLELDRPKPAIAELERLLMYDPGRPEALALLADAYTKANQPDKAQAAREEATRLFQDSPQARRDYDALLREARLGEWAGIPRP
ncbi:MAG TPA: DUF5107 domain-containing protein [Phycisphaerae bacterium]|nr:DUF5107 domain-containing protein [Phycisphaerae bacterium]